MSKERPFHSSVLYSPQKDKYSFWFQKDKYSFCTRRKTFRQVCKQCSRISC